MNARQLAAFLRTQPGWDALGDIQAAFDATPPGTDWASWFGTHLADLIDQDRS